MGALSVLKLLLLGAVFAIWLVPGLLGVLVPSYQATQASSNVPFSSLTLGLFALTGFVLIVGIIRRGLRALEEPSEGGYSIGPYR